MTSPSRPSRFGNLRALKERGAVPTDQANSPDAVESESTPPEASASTPQTGQEPAKALRGEKVRTGRLRPQRGITTLAEPESRRPGRPPGKRSDEEYRQVSALVRRDTYKAAQRRLLEDEREFSEVVQAFMEKWLRGEVTV